MQIMSFPNRIRANLQSTVVVLGAFRLELRRQSNGWSEDLTLRSSTLKFLSQRNVTVVSAATVVLEDPVFQKESSPVHILYEQLPTFIELGASESAINFTFVTIVQQQSDGLEELFELLHRAESELLDVHSYEWRMFWDQSLISVSGNAELSTSIRASMYAIASSLPSLKTHTKREPFYGLSPSGLGVGGPKLDGYRGHGFWDTEAWMLPPMLLLEPQWTRELLNYRFLMRNAAQANANEAGYKGIRSVEKTVLSCKLSSTGCTLISLQISMGIGLHGARRYARRIQIFVRNAAAHNGRRGPCTAAAILRNQRSRLAQKRRLRIGCADVGVLGEPSVAQQLHRPLRHQRSHGP